MPFAFSLGEEVNVRIPLTEDVFAALAGFAANHVNWDTRSLADALTHR